MLRPSGHVLSFQAPAVPKQHVRLSLKTYTRRPQRHTLSLRCVVAFQTHAVPEMHVTPDVRCHFGHTLSLWGHTATLDTHCPFGHILSVWAHTVPLGTHCPPGNMPSPWMSPVPSGCVLWPPPHAGCSQGTRDSLYQGDRDGNQPFNPPQPAQLPPWEGTLGTRDQRGLCHRACAPN